MSGESRAVVDGLSKEEFILEVNEGSRSRFQGDTFACLKTRLDRLKDQERSSDNERELEIDSEANRIARAANDIAERANQTSTKAYRMAVT